MSSQIEILRRKAIPAGFINILDATILVASTYVDQSENFDWGPYVGVFRSSVSDGSALETNRVT